MPQINVIIFDYLLFLYFDILMLLKTVLKNLFFIAKETVDKCSVIINRHFIMTNIEKKLVV